MIKINQVDQYHIDTFSPLEEINPLGIFPGPQTILIAKVPNGTEKQTNKQKTGLIKELEQHLF